MNVACSSVPEDGVVSDPALPLGLVFDAIEDGIVVLDPLYRILRTNARLRALYGTDAEPGRRCYEALLGRTEPCPWCPSRRAVTEGTPHTEVIRHPKDVSPARWLEVSTYPLSDGNGHVSGVVECLRDVTDRKRAEEALLTSKTDLKALFDGSRDTILILDTTTGEIVKASRQIAEMYGYPPEEAVGLTVADLSAGPPLYGLDEVRQRLRLIAEGPQIFEWRARRKDGTLFWIEVNATVVRFGGQERILAHERDITARKRAQEELELIREALDDCGSAVLMMDDARRVFYLNAAFGILFGCTKENVESVLFESTFSDAAAATEIVSAALEGASWEGEIELLRKDGSRFPALLRATPVLDDSFDICGALIILNDITDRKHLEAQVLQSQNLKSVGQLAAGIAHEINTPTQYVSDNTRFLRDSFADLVKVLDAFKAFAAEAGAGGAVDEDRLNRLEEVVQAADLEYLLAEVPRAINESLEGLKRVSDIVRAMRQFTHPGTGEMKNIDLNQAIESTITVARNEWRYVADMETHLDPNLPPVPCLPGDLNQVLLNLVTNAADAIADAHHSSRGAPPQGGAPEKGLITVSTRQDDQWAEIRVKDTGSGIPEAIRTRVFDPFFTTKDVGKGTGQGLAISRSVIVDKHHGELTFETEAGQGTTFIVRLPLNVGDAE